jgi:hypothetical protein
VVLREESPTSGVLGCLRNLFAKARGATSEPWQQPLPTLGLEAFAINRLNLQINGYERHVRILLGSKRSPTESEQLS